MNKKQLILNSGFTYRELLSMKNNFHAMRKWYRLERKPIPESEPGNFQKHIVVTADNASGSTIIISIISIIQGVYLRFENHDIKSPVVAFVIYLMMFLILIYFHKQDLGLNMTTIVKLIIFHYRIKMKTCIHKFSFKN